jgi:hypothetical protein
MYLRNVGSYVQVDTSFQLVRRGAARRAAGGIHNVRVEYTDAAQSNFTQIWAVMYQ